MSREPANGAPAVEARGLEKRFDGTVALSGVSFTARRGERLAVIGPNGAGKTTLLTILAGVRRPDGGSFRSEGKIGWVPQGTALYHRLTVAENLRLFARLEQVADVDAAVERMLDQTGLGDRRDDQVATLSGGNQQRINIAAGLLSAPAVLLLDEPSTGLDPRQRERLWGFVLGLADAGTTVVYSTHHLPEAERYATALLILADGERLFAGTADDLHAAVPPSADSDLESAFVAFLRQSGH
ncbi:MAG TPA: ABC transporter ATP-binding protein [Solirubrobacterales bacterium]|nr:ABC transporter ATP-binding protein [Solirubrobacterales bacterium]